MKHYCPNCETDSTVSIEKISIPVGKETFSTKTAVCKKCKHYALTPQVRREMDEWGKSMIKNIIEPQPTFHEASHQFIEKMAAHFSMKKVPFIKALTVFYINHIVNRTDFDVVRKYFETHHSEKHLSEGTKSKETVPIRYLMFRKLQTFSEVRNVSHAKAIEEAVLFGLMVLATNDEHFETLKTISQNLKQYIEDFAEAA